MVFGSDRMEIIAFLIGNVLFPPETLVKILTILSHILYNFLASLALDGSIVQGHETLNCFHTCRWKIWRPLSRIIETVDYNGENGRIRCLRQSVCSSVNIRSRPKEYKELSWVDLTHCLFIRDAEWFFFKIMNSLKFFNISQYQLRCFIRFYCITIRCNLDLRKINKNMLIEIFEK